MLTRILVPLDGSALAEEVLPLASAMARQLRGELALLRVVPPLVNQYLVTENGTYVYEDDLKTIVLRDARTYLRAVVQTLSERGVNAVPVLETGLPAEALLDYARATKADLIAMSTHGRGGLGRLAFGSVAHRVLLEAHVPVLLHRSGAQPRTDCPRRILVPLDGSVLAEGVLPCASEMARAFDAELLLARVAEPTVAGDERAAAAYLDHCRQRLEADGVQATTAVAKPPVARALLELADQADIDLIAMCTHGRSGLDRWVFGSVAEWLLREAQTPILLVCAKPANSGRAASSSRSSQEHSHAQA